MKAMKVTAASRAPFAVRASAQKVRYFSFVLCLIDHAIHFFNSKKQFLYV